MLIIDITLLEQPVCIYQRVYNIYTFIPMYANDRISKLHLDKVFNYAMTSRIGYHTKEYF